MARRTPHSATSGPAIEVRRRREIYVSAKAERRLDAAVALIGTAHGSGCDALAPAARAHCVRAERAFFARFPDHPGHPAWRQWPEDWAEVLESGDAAAHAAWAGYLAAQRRATDAWRAVHPDARAVHPLSAYWDAAWDTLETDWLAVSAAHAAFLAAEAGALAPMLGHPSRPLQRQRAKFLHDHWEALEYPPDDDRGRN